MRVNIHYFLTILVFVLSVIMALQAVVYARQNKSIKGRQFNRFFQSLPPLQTMEKRLYQILWYGFWLLSILIVTSLVSFWPEFAGRVIWMKFIVVCMVWSTFALSLCVRNNYRWHKSGLLAILMSGSLLISLCIISFISII